MTWLFIYATTHQKQFTTGSAGSTASARRLQVCARKRRLRSPFFYAYFIFRNTRIDSLNARYAVE